MPPVETWRHLLLEDVPYAGITQIRLLGLLSARRTLGQHNSEHPLLIR